MLADSKCGRRGVTPETGRRTSEEQRAALASASQLPIDVDLVVLEGQDDLTGERERRRDVGVEGFLQFLGGDVQEGFPHPVADVPERCADGEGRGREMSPDGIERVGYVGSAVAGDGERDSL